jgi:hypothetical protein
MSALRALSAEAAAGEESSPASGLRPHRPASHRTPIVSTARLTQPRVTASSSTATTADNVAAQHVPELTANVPAGHADTPTVSSADLQFEVPSYKQEYGRSLEPVRKVAQSLL